MPLLYFQPRLRLLLTYYSYDLPADLFAAGEIRPTRIKKAKAAPKPDDAAANKRSFSSTGLDVGDSRYVQRSHKPFTHD